MADKLQASVDVTRLLNIPTSIIKAELEGLYGTNVLEDMYEVIRLYNVYEHGAPYSQEGQLDYTPADLRYKTTRSLLDKEVRFLFSKSPDFYVDIDLSGNKEEREAAKDAGTIYQTLIDNVLEENGFKNALLKAAKDCFISKRVALMFNINEDSGIQVSFLPSLEFVYDVDPNNSNILTKIVAFYGLNNEKAKVNQRIYKKKYWMQNGLCYYSENVYNGMGQLVEEIQPDTQTRFTFIPAWVIVNDGLTGDLIGVSEISQLEDYESWYSRLSAADMDAERKGMNPIRYTVDASPESTKGLSISAGAFWDLSSDQNRASDTYAQVGVLDSPMSYSSALGTTLDRIKNTMYEQCAVPNVSPEALKGVVSSGKTLKAIYWDLIVRCDEKMLAWRPALQFLGKCIIEGVRLYPKAGQFYIDEALPDAGYTIRVDNQYSLPEDEQEEKQTDLAEVTAQTMSRKSYMKKWRNLTDDEVEEELRQIALERQILEDSYTGDTGVDFGEEDSTGAEGEEGDFGDDDIEDTELPSDVSVEKALKELEGLLNGV
nr:MAG TPA: PORTAL PROTEIN [Caudoviricetes sp.]